MKKLVNYLRRGKNHGILVMLLISVFFMVIGYFAYGFTAKPQIIKILNQPENQAFLQEFPVLPIKDGKIQADIVWARLIPGTNVPVVVNTASDEPTDIRAKGIYVTRSKVLNLQGRNWTFSELGLDNVDFSLKEFIVWFFNVLLPIIVAIVLLIGCWLFFLFTVLFSQMLAWAVRVPYDNGRAWRVGMVTCTAMILSSLNPVAILTPLIVAVFISVLLLTSLDNKEI